MVSQRVVAFFTLAVVLSGCGRFHRPNGAVTASPTAFRADVGRGQTIYAAQCAACHGVSGANGPIGPSLLRERRRHTPSQIEAIVRDPDPPMPKLYPGTISDRDVKDVSAYVAGL
ncbi:MAG: cytochrome c [Candidatus Eremiobacteraeota bacterium]|nr:cytochrome c [Candidatus Eremiobacteraeota bacterium]